jgi:hypothetical protein
MAVSFSSASGPGRLSGISTTSRDATFFDTQRQENCTFNSGVVRASDGTIRCLPSERLTYQSTFYFQDPSCLQRIAAALKTECPPVYAASYSMDRCPLMMTVYRLDAPFVLPEGGTLYYLNSSGQCVAYPGTSFLVQSSDLYVVGDEVSPSNFVEASSVAVGRRVSTLRARNETTPPMSSGRRRRSSSAWCCTRPRRSVCKHRSDSSRLLALVCGGALLVVRVTAGVGGVRTLSTRGYCLTGSSHRLLVTVLIVIHHVRAPLLYRVRFEVACRCRCVGVLAALLTP